MSQKIPKQSIRLVLEFTIDDRKLTFQIIGYPLTAKELDLLANDSNNNDIAHKIAEAIAPYLDKYNEDGVFAKRKVSSAPPGFKRK